MAIVKRKRKCLCEDGKQKKHPQTLNGCSRKSLTWTNHLGVKESLNQLYKERRSLRKNAKGKKKKILTKPATKNSKKDMCTNLQYRLYLGNIFLPISQVSFKCVFVSICERN